MSKQQRIEQLTTESGLDAEAYERVRSFAWCSWHKDFTDTARLVNITEQGSARAGGQFACAPCRAKHNLVPVADQPL
ncbi:hypothetical protein AB0H18_19905 [Streptomyces sp. NPDC020766]|uniref:hypothetical protein n=1 Tax=Streptomyces sp. NPDC020766 TaxID=3155011 RepID=UPI0033F064A1